MVSPQVLASNVLANGLRSEFTDTYLAIRNRQADGRLAQVMDLSIGATNRQHEFAYFEAGPHIELWRRGDSIAQDGMGSVKFTATVHNWGKRVGWHENDRDDDQTQSLMDAARMAGESYGLLPERMFFDLIGGTTATLPFVPTAPDGAAFFATTAGGAARFGATNGNLLTGSTLGSVANVTTDYYAAIKQFMLFQDGKGQPLFSPETIGAGVVIIHASADMQIFEEAFVQKRQGLVKGTDAGVTPSNVIQDASRNVDLWASPRIATGDWYVFLKNAPKKATFHLERQVIRERTALSSDNNGENARTTGEEYIQWDSRDGAGIALPYGAIKVNN